MVRRRRSAEETVSLFPFLSILACVIGVLTLMITAMALGQMEESGPSEEEIARQGLLYEQLQQRIASSNAVATYNTARNVSRSRYCKNGKLPVSGMGEIDLSLFKQIAGEAK